MITIKDITKTSKDLEIENSSSAPIGSSSTTSVISKVLPEDVPDLLYVLKNREHSATFIDIVQEGRLFQIQLPPRGSIRIYESQISPNLRASVNRGQVSLKKFESTT